MSSTWNYCLNRLEGEIPDQQFNTWIRPRQAVEEDSSVLKLLAPNRFVLEWVKEHYLSKIENALRSSVNSHSWDVKLEIGSLISPRPINWVKPGRPALPRISSAKKKFPANLNTSFTFDTFVVGKSNQLAKAASIQVAENVGGAYNPLFIYGGVGLGKTHLMHAIGNMIQKNNPTAKISYLHSERFVADMVKALQHNTIDTFKKNYRSLDALLIDDIQFFAGKERSQEEFFHTFNELVDQNKQIVISADRSPSDLEDVEERIRSRLGWGLVVDIHQTDFELRLGILEAKLARANMGDFPPKVLEFLAHRITSNIRELEGALNRLIAHSHLVGRPINLEMTQETLQDLLRANDRRVTIEEIQKKVAQHFNIRLADMHSARRARAVARPRQVAMYLAKQLTTRSLPEIGRKFGGRDHTTVMHAVKRIEELRQTDAALAEDIDLLRRMLEA